MRVSTSEEKRAAAVAAQDPILVVDDDPNDVLLLKRAAMKANLLNPFVVVPDGEKACEYLEGVVSPKPGAEPNAAPLAVLIDLKMPRMSGFELLEWMRARKGLKRLPVVVLTSSNQPPDVNRAYDLGANSFLVKPLTFQGLIDLLAAFSTYWSIHNQRPDVSRSSG